MSRTPREPGRPVRRFVKTGAACLIAYTAIFALGLLWLRVWYASRGLPSDWHTVLADGLYPFVPGAILKLGLTLAIVPPVLAFRRRRGW